MVGQSGLVTVGQDQGVSAVPGLLGAEVVRGLHEDSRVFDRVTDD